MMQNVRLQTPENTLLCSHMMFREIENSITPKLVCQISSSYVLCFKSRRHWSCMRMHCKVLKEQPPRQPDVCTCKYETSGALQCLSILQTIVTRLQTPCQKPQSPSGSRLTPSPIHSLDLGRIIDPPKCFQSPIPHRGTPGKFFL